MSSVVGSDQDVRELRRGVAVTYAGYAVQIAMPVLTALVTRAYGAEGWGLFVSAQAVVLVAMRVCLLGLDKALLWAIPGRPQREALTGVLPALGVVALGATAVCAALQLVSHWLPTSARVDPDTLRVVALGLVPMALSELLLHATMGLRRMELQVAVRETLSPIAQAGFALLLFEFGAAGHGLAWAFVASQLLALLVAWFGFRRLFAGSPLRTGDTLRVPRPLLRYALPLWLAEIVNSFALRLDTLVLTALAEPATVGIWAVVAQFANALRQMRRAYDPIVLAIAARIAVQHDRARLADSFSYAAQMVSLTQLPVFALLACFAAPVLALYGPGFGAGASALTWLAGLFLLSGGAGLAGLVVSGYGKSTWTLLNTVAAATLQLALLVWLVPRHGLDGAAIAVGGALCAINVVQLVQMKSITGSFNFTHRSRFSLRVVVGSMAGLALGAAAATALALGVEATRLCALAGFALAYLALCARGVQTGELSLGFGRSKSTTPAPASS